MKSDTCEIQSFEWRVTLKWGRVAERNPAEFEVRGGERRAHVAPGRGKGNTSLEVSGFGGCRDALVTSPQERWRRTRLLHHADSTYIRHRPSQCLQSFEQGGASSLHANHTAFRHLGSRSGLFGLP